MPTGCEFLDRGLKSHPDCKVGGFVAPSFVLIGGPPKTYKSTLCDTIVKNYADAGGFALVIDIENGPLRYLKRRYMRHTGLTDADLEGKMTSDKQAISDQYNEEVEGKPYGRTFYHTGIDLNRRFFRRMVDHYVVAAESTKKPLLVLVDSLQKLPQEAGTDRRHGIDNWLKCFEQTRANAYSIIIAVSEIPRAAPDPKTKKVWDPETARYKESGEAEYTCDLGLMLNPLNGHRGGPVEILANQTRDGTSPGHIGTFMSDFTMRLHKCSDDQEEARIEWNCFVLLNWMGNQLVPEKVLYNSARTVCKVSDRAAEKIVNRLDESGDIKLQGDHWIRSSN